MLVPLIFSIGCKTMNKTELLNKLSAAPEERLLLSKALDQITIADTRSIPTHTGFLSPGEALAVERLMEQTAAVNHVFVGGFDEAERRRCCFLPDWQEPEDVDPGELVAAVRATWFASHGLTHRDFLGSLMGLGLKREAIGDILVSEGSCDILLLPELQFFVTENLEYAGHEKLRVEAVPLENLHFPQPKLKVIHDTVPSLRLDAVAAAGFNISRSKLTDFIHAGKVTVNWQSVTRSDFAVGEGDVISCRGLGKCRLAEVGRVSRKGRLNVTIERYV